MRIVQMIMRRQRRGAEVFAVQLADALAGRGHDVLLLALYEPPTDALLPELARFVDLGVPAGKPLSIRALRQVAAAIHAEHPDLVQANGADTLKYSAVVRKLGRHRWPLVYRNISIASRWLRFPGQRAWMTWLSQEISHVAAVSTESRLDFQQAYEVPDSRISTIPNGTPIPYVIDREKARARLSQMAGISSSVPMVLHIGSFSPEKNHAWAVEIFSRILKECPDAHLLLIGDGPLRAQIVTLAARAGLEGSVHLLGTVADAAALTAGADVLVLTSHIEGLPGVVIEAAAHATPVVSTNVGSIPEAIVQDETGFLVELGDTEGFASAVLRLLRDPVLRSSMGTSARGRTQERFGLEGVISGFETLYRDLLNGQRV